MESVLDWVARILVLAILVIVPAVAIHSLFTQERRRRASTEDPGRGARDEREPPE